MAIKRKGKLPLLPTEDDFNLKIETIFNKVGRYGVEWAIQNHEFRNRTGNLEDSYGYGVYKNGTIQGEPFITSPKATKPNNGKYGYREARDFLNSYRPSSDGWTLVVIAGMEYASFVQFYFDLDVLQGSEIMAKKEAINLFKKIKWTSR
jgi:hypothetical protein